MVSPVGLTRYYSARIALGVLKDGSSSSDEGNSSSTAGRLLDSLGISSGGAGGLDSRSLMQLMSMLQNQQNNPYGSDEYPPAEPPFTTMGSKDFMTALKDKLSQAGDDPASYINSQDMLQALKDGTLKITDPVNGETIIGWDPSVKGATANKPETADKDEWSAFLNEHLKRGPDGSFERSKNGAYIDAKTGENAYFGKVNGKYYYFTWPAEGAAGADKPATN
jgi:hypothetical protein